MPATTCVITSYSIHYTKLYDEKVDGLELDLVQFGLGLACRIAEKRLKRKKDLMLLFLEALAFALDLALDPFFLHEQRFELLLQPGGLFGKDVV